MAINEEKMNDLLGRFLNDFGGTFHSAMAVIGDKLGFVQGNGGSGPLSSEELAKRTVLPTLACAVARISRSGECMRGYDRRRDGSSDRRRRFALTDERAVFLPGAFQLALAAVRSEPRIATAFKTGEGVGWHEHDPGLFGGTERFFRPGYAAHLVDTWIPAFEGLEDKLKSGVKVADIGCGHGASTILMARAYPKSTFVGFDYHRPSVEHARFKAQEEGVADRVTFEIATAKDYASDNYDLVAFFDALHDMGDPVGAAKHVLGTLKSDGSWMIVEPFANDKIENLTDRRIFLARRILLPASRALNRQPWRAQARRRGT
jgi:2-polyprenyl-3-methyl-5-hydroxy-6-metoxy-1,4-benzoquinol methylase